jgi:fatty acid desaturase
MATVEHQQARAVQTEQQNPAVGVANRQEFAELSRQVRDGDLLARRRGYYTIKIGTTVGALVALVVTAVIVGNSWWNLVVAVGLAVVLAQMGFIGHDAGHRQICAHRRGNDLIGLIHANLLTGFSFGWWLTKHNRHHAHTNRPGKDPDVAPGALVYTPGEAGSRGRFGRSFARVQAFALVPLLLLEAINLHVASVVSLAHRRGRSARVEVALLTVHLVVFFVAPFFLLSPVRAVVFVAVTQMLLGLYLGATFVTNHVGMPIPADDDLGFLRRQVLTSRNLASPPVVGFFFGGLDSQIEHHLFPTMPRANLRRARELVRPFCAEHQIDYVEQRPHRAYGDVFRHLRLAGARSAVPAVR